MKRFNFLADDGMRWILSALLVCAVLWVQLGIFAAVPALLLALALTRYYYDPDRELPSHPLGVMSPVDGTVLAIELIQDPFLARTVQRIRVRSDLLGVYHARSPIEGKMTEYWPILPEDKPPYSQATTSAAMWITTDEGDNVIVVLQAKFAWQRTYCAIQAGERLGQARRCGRFPAGCIVDLLLDEKSFIQSVPGQRVTAGLDTLATFNHDIESTQ